VGVVRVGDLAVGHLVADAAHPDQDLLGGRVERRVRGVAGGAGGREDVAVRRRAGGPARLERAGDGGQLVGEPGQVLELARRRGRRDPIAGLAEHQVLDRVEALLGLGQVADVGRGQRITRRDHRLEIGAVDRPRVHRRIEALGRHRAEQEALALLPRHPGGDPRRLRGGEVRGGRRRAQREGGVVQRGGALVEQRVGRDDDAVGEVGDHLVVGEAR
jgi:hypothetical protein